MTLLTLALALWFDRADRESRRNAFYSLAQTQADICAGEFDHLNSQLKQLVCFFESSQGVSREEFKTYCKEMITDGLVEACVWLPEVPEAEASTFIQNVRATGRPGFSIWQKNEHSVHEPVEPRSVYYPALYIEPLTGHETALGYDLNSEPARRVAIQETLRTGRATATDSGKLITLTNQPPGFVIFQRVNTPVLKGLAAFALCPENLLGGAQHQTRKNPGLKVCLFQLREGAEPLFMAGSSGECGLSCFLDVEAGLHLTVPVFRFGKAYALNLIADESWLEANPLHAARNVMGIGLLTALLFSFVVFMVANRRHVLEKLVERSTAELLASEAAMRESQQLIEGIINTIPVRVFWKDKNLVFLGCNAAFARDAGFTAPQDLIGKDDYQMGWREQAARYRADDRQVIESGIPKFMVEEPQTTPAGKTITLLTSKIPLRDANGEICGILGTYLDITSRKQAEERIRDLVQHLEEIREVEHKRISRELHDEIGQTLTALKIDLIVLKDECNCQSKVKDRMGDMQKLLNEGIQSIHSLCSRMRPSALDDIGLAEALSGLAGDWKQRNQLTCNLYIDIDDEALSDDLRTTVFRMVQESLTNVSRYAKASKVDINLVADEQTLHISIADDGCGMEAGAENKQTSFGLLGMRERVEKLGGTLHIESEPGKGTRIDGSIPLSVGGGR
jgi:PAS domain S-box-containing protein